MSKVEKDYTLPPVPNTVHDEKPKLLVVEDDQDLRTQMKWALTQYYEVFLAEDRSSAIEILNREKPLVVTLDLGLPFLILKELKKVFLRSPK